MMGRAMERVPSSRSCSPTRRLDVAASPARATRRPTPLRRAHFAALRGAIAEHGGREVSSTGDGLMVAFASAVAAMRCAVAMQRATTGRGGLATHRPRRRRAAAGRRRPLRHAGDRRGAGSATPPARARSSPPRSSAGSPRRASRSRSPAAGALRLRDVSERIAASQVLWRDDAAGRRRARAGDRADRRRRRRRPAARARRLPGDPRRRARHPRGRRGGRRPDRRGRDPAHAARRRAAGHPHARARRPRCRRAHPRATPSSRPRCSC